MLRFIGRLLCRLKFHQWATIHREEIEPDIGVFNAWQRCLRPTCCGERVTYDFEDEL